MSDDSDKPPAAIEMSPSPHRGFETELIREVEGLVAGLPAGVARLRISRVPGHPEWPEPYFEVTPTNEKAARFDGIAVATDLYLTIGKAEREFCGFASGGNVVRGASWQDELRWIWQTVIAGGFTQRHYLNARGQVIAWSARLVVNGRELVFRNGRREKLFGRAYTKEEIVTYEPYV